ncbi:MAG: threonylcarbamoyl-AMP synthase [Clostridiaceae bacterium]|nr:threonylcarbamoyl-AMP synthase [Clostridiaceae bacterium]
MQTKYIEFTSCDAPGFLDAARALKEGRLVAFPTETVYGLGANALDRKAVRSIYVAKGRPVDNPLIVHISDLEMLKPLVTEIKPDVLKLISAYWPGPLTIIMKKTSVVPDITTGGLDTVAVRMPDNPVALELIRKAGVPVAAPSANRSGRPSPTMAKHVLEDLNGKISYIIDGGQCKVGVESTVVDMTVEPAVILRPGGITPLMIKQVLGSVELDRSLIEKADIGKPKSPGMKYKHYAPKAEVFVVSGDYNDIVNWLSKAVSEDKKSGIKSVVLAAKEHIQEYGLNNAISFGSINDASEVASNIFRLFRECDRIGAEKIYVEAIPKEGIGLAVMNRIEKAAGGKIIQAGE